MSRKESDLLTVREVSQILCVHIRTIQRLSKQGKIRAIRVGKLWRYKRSDIEQYHKYGIDFSKEPVRIPHASTSHLKKDIGFIERRAYPRINCSILCNIKVIIPQKKKIYTQARIQNISEGGVFLENYDNKDEFLDIRNDDPINLKFEINKNVLEADGRVLRNKDRGIAVKFKKLNPYIKNIVGEFVG